MAPAHGVAVAGLAYGADILGERRTLIDEVIAEDTKLVIEQVYPFFEALTALTKVQTRSARGKIVLSPVINLRANQALIEATNMSWSLLRLIASPKTRWDPV